MKKVLIAITALLFTAGLAAAQNSATDDTPRSGKQVTVEGCLGGEPGNFTVLTKGGQTMMIQGSNKDLQKLIGHSVRISGTAAPGTPTTTTATSEVPNGASNTGAQKVLAVDSSSNITDLSATCKQSSTKAQPNDSNEPR